MSKFKGVFPTEQSQSPSPTVNTKAKVKAKILSKPEPAPLITTKAKRDTPGLKQVSGFIREETHKELRKALIDNEKDFSELLQELVDEWLANRENG